MTPNEQSTNLTNREKLEKFEEWACDECGVRSSTCTSGGKRLCNPCAFGGGA